MNYWFNCKIKYVQEDSKGKEKKINEEYLIEAISYTEAEARAYAKVEEIMHGEFGIETIKKTNIAEIFFHESVDFWYECKVNYVHVDEETGKEKVANRIVLVSASDFTNAHENIRQDLSDMVIPVDILQIKRTNILDVFPYLPEESVQKLVPEGFKPVENNDDSDKTDDTEDNSDL